MPTWMRWVQQQWWFNILLVPALITAAPAVYECAGTDLANLSIACFKKGGAIAIAYMVAAFQHSYGSASFNPNGTPNQQVEEVVKADHENKPVVVVPVPTPQVREEIKQAVAAGVPIEVKPK